MTTPRPDETGPSQNSSYRDTRSRSLQRIVRPIVLARCEWISEQLQMLEKARRKGNWGFMVLRDREALVWQNGHREVFFLVRGLRLHADEESSGSRYRGEGGCNPASSDGPASEPKA